MKTRRGRASQIPALAIAALLVTAAACGEQSRVAPDATITVTGRVLAPDGGGAVERPVKLGTGITEGEAAFAVLTIGLSCTTGACTGNVRDAVTDDSGRYSFALKGSDTQSSFGEAESVLVTTSGAPGEGELSGPMASARFRVQKENVELMALELVDPGLSVEDGGGVVARWSTAKAAPYELSYENGSDVPVWLVTTKETSATVDARLLEDSAGRAVLAGRVEHSIEGSAVDMRWRSPGVPYAANAGSPPSRGRPCHYVDASGAIGESPAGCELTDGDLAGATTSPTECPPSAAAAPCAPAVAAIVDLGEPVPAELVAVRGCEGGCAVEASADGTTFRPIGSVSDGFGAIVLDGQPVRAVKVGVGTSGVGLREISVWGPAPKRGLLPVDDAGRAELAAPYDGSIGGRDRPPLLLVLLAAVAVASLLLGVGIAFGRRHRSSAA